MPYRLTIHEGPYNRTLAVSDPLLTVGSSGSCGLRLEGDGIARRHARLRQYGRCVVVEDLGARDGVIVRGALVRRAILRAGDDFRIGSARLRVLDVTAAVAPTPSVLLRHRTAADRERGRQRCRSARPSRAAPVAFSMGFHGLLLAVLWGWVLFRGATPEEEAHIDVSDIAALPQIPDTEERAPAVDPLDVVQRDRDTVDLLPPDVELPEVPLLDDDPRFRPPPRPQPAPPTPPDVAASTAPVIGIGRGDPAPEVGSRSFGKDDSAAANRMAAGLLESDAGVALRSVRGGASKATVWVARGDYDQAEKVLSVLEIPFTLVAKGGLETHEIPKSLRVLVFNCTGTPVTPETQSRIAWWVYEGGWLVTTDWGVEKLIEKGLPGTLLPLRDGERPVLTKDETVGVRSTSDRGLGAGTLQDGAARWWLEDSSVPFTIAPGIGAEVLVRSDDLDRRHGHDASGVAVTFPYGKGRVLHLLGHVYQQEGNVRGALIVHRLVVNFLAAALR